MHPSKHFVGENTMTDKKYHLDTLAVREAVDKSQYGENSESLYLTSSFTQPDCATAAWPL
jgi:hypothetical protein